MSLYIMCVIMLVQFLVYPDGSKPAPVSPVHPGCVFLRFEPSLLVPVSPTEGRHSNFHKDNFSFKAIIICVWHDLLWFLKDIQKTKQLLQKKKKKKKTTTKQQQLYLG